MSDEAATVSITTTKSKSKWRWVRRLFLLAIAAIITLRFAVSYDSLDLEVTRRDFIMNGDGQALEMTNTGAKAVSITAIEVNNRSDCSTFPAGALLNPTAKTLFPATLKVGDRVTIGSSCRIVRVTIRSDKASAEYTFNR